MHNDTEHMASGEPFTVTSVDMQKALLMPKLEVKDYYFSRKLVLFNETFTTPGSNEESLCIVWHKRKAGRSASNVSNV